MCIFPVNHFLKLNQNYVQLVHVQSILLLRHEILQLFSPLLLLGLNSEFLNVFELVIWGAALSKHVTYDTIRIVLGIDFGLFKLFIVVFLDLLVQGFLYLFLDQIFFKLLLSDSLILHGSFFESSLINKPVLNFHIFHSSLSFKFLIILVDSFVLSEIFILIRSFIEIVILIL